MGLIYKARIIWLQKLFVRYNIWVPQNTLRFSLLYKYVGQFAKV